MSREMVSSTLSPLFLIVSETWGREGVMEKSHGRCDEHYPVIMKGTQLYCQPLQTGRQAGTDGPAGCREAFVHSCVYVPLYLYLETRINRHIYIFTPCQRGDCLIYRSLQSQRGMPRANQVKCAFFVNAIHGS